MAKFNVSEIFMSQEGEAKYVGHPTVYARFAKCNFKCAGFNGGIKNKSGYAELQFDPKSYNKLSELPVITQGCDSQYAVNPEFSHMWESLDERQIAERLIKEIPCGGWNYNHKFFQGTNLPIIFSITGGEPTLYQKQLPDLLFHPSMDGCEHILIETNCSVPIRDDFVEALNKWCKNNPKRKITWSNSPKLSSSGEDWKKAIKPEVAAKQMSVTGNVEQYFKFVVGAKREDFDEVNRAMGDYYNLGGISRSVTIYAMPEACTGSQQNDIVLKVAEMCLEYGFVLCYRMQNAVYENAIGK